jgi:acetyl-CoA carboxylase biotin carboxyl carrier protein
MNITDMKELINEISKSQICDFTYEENGVKLSLSKGCVANVIPETAQKKVIYEEPDTAEINQIDEKVIKSPLVGTIYMAPSEGEAPFVSVGDYVKKGQALAIVEAMKLMNEIESEYDGVIKEICVQNESPVEFGQTLFVME